MLSLITIFGSTISTHDFWAGMLMLSAPVSIAVACYVARTGRVNRVFGVILLIVVGACLLQIFRG